MADNFVLKIGIEGEKEFKNALRDINQSFKVLGSEMNLVSSQFDKNDRSVQALTARNQVLNKEIDTQKDKIDTLEKALSNAASSFGENDKRTQAWQVQLNNAKAELNGLEKELKQKLGQGLSPQVLHMMDNVIWLIYLTSDGTVKGTEAFPALGLYDTLSFTEKGRFSADLGVTNPSLKKVAHYGAYGFWCADTMHKFVMYMLPTDVSHTLLNGSISYSKGSPISQFSVNLQNAGGELVGRYHSIIAPNTKLELYFTLGSSAELSLGQFYIDRVSIGYPEQSISVTARNAIGKLLKEQTFDVNTVFTASTLQENLSAILTLAEVENFFVTDAQKPWKLTFEPQVAILDGIQNVIQLLPSWQISENTDGTVGIGPVTDGRFEQPSTYIFERDKTCWSYNIDYDDEQTVSKLCITCKEPANTVFRQLPPHKWWVSPPNKTLYITVPDGTSLADMNAYADELADSVAVSGRIEGFVGIFTPHMLIGDAVELVEPDRRHSMIGTVTSVKHNLGRNGFYTEFTVDSGGRKGKPFLKDFVSQTSGAKKINGVVISE